MKRKIVQHGSSSLSVTLPSKWVKTYGLKKGNEVNVQEAGSTIKISTQKESTLDVKNISLKDYGVFSKNNLVHLYQLGYDEINIRFLDIKTLNEIKRGLPSCIGYEIIDQTTDRVKIKAIATTIETEFDTLFRKAFQVTNEMAKNLQVAIKNNDYSNIEEIRSMESLNNKLTDVCLRILNKRGYKEQNKSMQMYELVKSLERLADEFKYICDLLSASKIKISSENVKLYENTINYYLEFYVLFFKFNQESHEKIISQRKKLLEKLVEQMKISKSTNAVFVHYLINIVQKTYDMNGALFALKQ